MNRLSKVLQLSVHTIPLLIRCTLATTQDQCSGRGLLGYYDLLCCIRIPTFQRNSSASIFRVKTFFHKMCLQPLKPFSYIQGEPEMSSKMSVSYCNTTWYHNPEDVDFKLHHSENLKSQPVFSNRAVHVRFVMNKMTLEQVSLQVSWFSLPTIIPPMLQTHLSTHMTCLTTLYINTTLVLRWGFSSDLAFGWGQSKKV
jgi:hypothetical protein